MQIMARVSSSAAALAAIRAGAHELLLGLPVSADDMREILQLSRSRGLRTVLDYTWPCTDRELLGRARQLEDLYSLGLDSVLVADAGHLRMVHMVAPECAMEWGGACLTPEELQFAARQKCVRAFLSPFITQNELLWLCSDSPLPLAGLVLGPLCPAGGQARCYLDAERGQYGCAAGCRLPFGYEDKAERPLLLTHDLCLLSHRAKLAGLHTALVVSPDPDPRVTDFFVRTCRSVLADGDPFQAQIVKEAMTALGRPEPTDAPFTGTGKVFAQDFTPGEKNESFWDAKAIAGRNERQQNTVPIRFFALINADAPARLAADDYKGHTIYVSGPVPTRSDESMREAEANTQWYKGGEMYRCEEARTRIDPGVRLSMVEMARMRAEALRQLTQARSKPPERRSGEFIQGMTLLPRADVPVITVKVSKISQVTAELLEVTPERLYIPLDELWNHPDKAKSLLTAATVPVVVFPRIVRAAEKQEVLSRLGDLYGYGYREALVFSQGQLALAVEAGYSIRVDWAMSNSQELKAAKSMGLSSCTLAPWLTLQEVQGLCHLVDTELPAYGRLPLMHVQACLIKPKSGLCGCDNPNTIIDASGSYMPLQRDCGHTTLIYHAHKLWLGEVEKLWKHIGLWAVRLDFTTENPRECVQVTRAYMHKERYKPHTYTTGFYLTPGQVQKSTRRK